MILDRKQSAFTLIELLIYSALSGVIILAVSAFVFIIWQSQAKSRTISEVEQQGAQIMDNILRQIRAAEAINSPVPTNNASTLNLAALAPNNPIVIDEVGGDLRLTLGANAPIVLDNNQVTISNLSFANYGRNNTTGSIRVSFSVSYINNSNRQAYDYQQTFIGTASPR